MKRALVCCLAFLLCPLALLLFGCARESEDFFLSLNGDFTADIEGEMHEVSFAAKAFAAGKDGARCVTITFYAPREIAGTVLSFSGGEIALSAGEYQVVGGAAENFRPLFDLLSPDEQVKKVGKDDAEHTVVTGESSTYLFFSDGTPYEAKNGAAHITFVSFSCESAAP